MKVKKDLKKVTIELTHEESEFLLNTLKFYNLLETGNKVEKFSAELYEEIINKEMSLK